MLKHLPEQKFRPQRLPKGEIQDDVDDGETGEETHLISTPGRDSFPPLRKKMPHVREVDLLALERECVCVRESV